MFSQLNDCFVSYSLWATGLDFIPWNLRGDYTFFRGNYILTYKRNSQSMIWGPQEPLKPS